MSLANPDAPGYRRHDDSIQQATVTFMSGDKAITVEQFAPNKEDISRCDSSVHGCRWFAIRELATLLPQSGTGPRPQRLRGVLRPLLRPHRHEVRRQPLEQAALHHLDANARRRHDLRRQQPNVDDKRIGLVGTSLGAYLVVSVAATDERIGAVVVFSGGVPQLLVDHLTACRRADPARRRRQDRAAQRRAETGEGAEGQEPAIRDQDLPGSGSRLHRSRRSDAQQRTRQFLDQHLTPAAP